MSLIKAFPEVELFFENDEFSQEELICFIKDVEKKYSDKEIRKSLSTLIKLKILQYEISEEKELRGRNIVAKTKEIGAVLNQENRFQPLLQSLKYNSIENIALNIQWPTKRLIRLLEQKGISKCEQDLLNEHEFSQIKEMLNNRLYGLDRMDKMQNPVIIKKYESKYQSNQIDVYSKIETMGLGKIIYIRKK